MRCAARKGHVLSLPPFPLCARSLSPAWACQREASAPVSAGRARRVLQCLQGARGECSCICRARVPSQALLHGDDILFLALPHASPLSLGARHAARAHAAAAAPLLPVCVWCVVWATCQLALLSLLRRSRNTAAAQGLDWSLFGGDTASRCPVRQPACVCVHVETAARVLCVRVCHVRLSTTLLFVASICAGGSLCWFTPRTREAV